MTMALSISFSRATASAMASSSALLALAGAVVGASVAMTLVLVGFFDGIGGVGDEALGQAQLGRRNACKGQAMFVVFLVGDEDIFAIDTAERSVELLPAIP